MTRTVPPRSGEHSEGARSSARGRRLRDEALRRWNENQALAATQELSNADTTFRVYHPTESRSMELRPSYLPSPSRGTGAALPVVDAKVPPIRILAGLGAGLGITLMLFVAFVVIGNLTDDTPKLGIVPRPGAAVETSPPTTPTPILTPIVSPPTGTDFEIPDDTSPPQRSAAKTKGKQGKRRMVRGTAN